jgi:SpoU rRNA methylase family enzyme
MDGPAEMATGGAVEVGGIVTATPVAVALIAVTRVVGAAASTGVPLLEDAAGAVGGGVGTAG